MQNNADLLSQIPPTQRLEHAACIPFTDQARAVIAREIARFNQAMNSPFVGGATKPVLKGVTASANAVPDRAAAVAAMVKASAYRRRKARKGSSAKSDVRNCGQPNQSPTQLLVAAGKRAHPGMAVRSRKKRL